MNKQYGIVVAVVVVIVLVIGGLYMTLPEDQAVQKTPSDRITFFYSDICSHCKKVEDYVAQNAVHDKVQFEEKEIHNNEENSKELTAVAKNCGIEENEVGVPLLWTGEKCLVGDKDIIAFFAEKIGGDMPTE